MASSVPHPEAAHTPTEACRTSGFPQIQDGIPVIAARGRGNGDGRGQVGARVPSPEFLRSECRRPEHVDQEDPVASPMPEADVRSGVPRYCRLPCHRAPNLDARDAVAQSKGARIANDSQLGFNLGAIDRKRRVESDFVARIRVVDEQQVGIYGNVLPIARPIGARVGLRPDCGKRNRARPGDGGRCSWGYDVEHDVERFYVRKQVLDCGSLAMQLHGRPGEQLVRRLRPMTSWLSVLREALRSRLPGPG